MLTDAHGHPVELPQKPPSVGHSISTASTPELRKGSISSEGVLSGETRYQQFKERLRHQKQLKKSTAQDQVVDRILGSLDIVNAYLDEATLFQKLEDARLRDISLFWGLHVDKLKELNARPTTALSTEQHTKLDEVLPAIMAALTQRGLTITATQQRLEVTTS